MSASARSPLSYPAFRVLWLAGVVTFLGSFVQQVAEAWVMMDLTKSPLPVAILAGAAVCMVGALSTSRVGLPASFTGDLDRV